MVDKWPPKPKPSGCRVEIPPGNTPVIESPGAVVSRPNGPQAQVIQTNSLSTPVFVVLVLALFIASLVSASAIMLAVSAKDAAVIAEREARLAQRRYDDLRVYLEIQEGTNVER